MWDKMMGMELGTCLLRLLLALICGGVLGIERGRKKRPAGFRTYMLVCIGASLVMMTNEYICDIYGTGDPARMGSQVISGIGFLGAGTIIVTGHSRVKGLTTAAGLWAAACIGLAIGIGFYGGAILGTGVIFLAMSSLNSLDDRVMASSRILNLYLEVDETYNLRELISSMKERRVKIIEMEMMHSNKVRSDGTALLLSLQLGKGQSHELILRILKGLDGVNYLEEL